MRTENFVAAAAALICFATIETASAETRLDGYYRYSVGGCIVLYHPILSCPDGHCDSPARFSVPVYYVQSPPGTASPRNIPPREIYRAHTIRQYGVEYLPPNRKDRHPLNEAQPPVPVPHEPAAPPANEPPPVPNSVPDPTDPPAIDAAPSA